MGELLSTKQVRAFFGDAVSEMTLWRWTRELGFPAPDKVARRSDGKVARKWWRRATVERWLKRFETGKARA